MLLQPPAGELPLLQDNRVVRASEEMCQKLLDYVKAHTAPGQGDASSFGYSVKGEKNTTPSAGPSEDIQLFCSSTLWQPESDQRARQRLPGNS